jgi:signal transduction histidine kinase/CheY-like chemotaxis protein
MALILLALNMFHAREVVFAFAFLPMIAAVTVGWWFALASEGAVIGLVLLLASGRWEGVISGNFGLSVILGGLVAGLLGWVTTHAFLTLADWAMTSFRQARINVEEARRQREELFQTQEDLLQANRELARLTNRLKVLNQVAEEARRVKEEFVANVSHELRTPLNMVIGFCEVIADSPRVYGSLPQALLADISAIQRNGKHLAELVNDVLDLSQIEAGRMALTKDWTTVQEIVQSAVEAVRALFDSKGLYLRTEIQEEPLPLFCDSTRMREVLLNLLSNAGRFTDRGGVTVTVRMESGQLIANVSDTGPGISEENQKKLFEPFQQLDNSIRRRGGSGLGLSISKRFVEMHGGRMWVESKLGQGTTFSFALPLESPVAALDGSSARRWINPYFRYERSVRRSKAPAPTLVPRYVLLETGDALRRLFSRYFEGVEYTQTRDLPSAMEELARSPSQALVVNMLCFPDHGAVISERMDLPYGASLIECWVPGEDDPSRPEGVSRYLTKPVGREELLTTVAQVLCLPPGCDEAETGLSSSSAPMDGTPSVGAPSIGAPSVLIVDDQPEILQLFGRMLASADRPYVVMRAKNGVTALRMMRERRPDLVLLDLLMPELDGFTVLREKNADERIRDIPVIVVSANDPSGTPIISDRVAIHRMGGFSASEFLACVSAVSEILSPKAPPEDRALEADLVV